MVMDKKTEALLLNFLGGEHLMWELDTMLSSLVLALEIINTPSPAGFGGC
jgi:hypothetical protein